VVGHPVPGLVVVAGGKYTTYRVMAADAVDEAVRGLDARVPDSCTDQVPLLGADGYRALWNQRRALAVSAGIHVARVEHLLNRYGSCVHELLTMLRDEPSLATALPGADDYLQVEALYAVTHEGARHLDDVLARRTRISIESWDRGRPDGGPAGLGREAETAGDRALSAAGPGRARLADQTRRHHRRSRPARRA
jgi:glycerol-3-phosphate dehydrogenase